MNACLLTMSTLESLGEIVGLLLVFILVLAAAYVTTRWIAKHTAGTLKTGNIKVIETYKLGPNRYLQIVRVADRYLVLAVSKDQITFLTEVSEEELVFPPEKGDSEVPFQELFKKAARGKKKD